MTFCSRRHPAASASWVGGTRKIGGGTKGRWAGRKSPETWRENGGSAAPHPIVCHSERSEESPQFPVMGVVLNTYIGYNLCKPEGNLADYLSLSRLRNASRVPSIRFRNMCRLLFLLVSDCCELALSTRTICSLKKSDLLCFQVLLGFVSPILVFSRIPLDFRRSGGLETRRIFLVRAPPERVRSRNA